MTSEGRGPVIFDPFGHLCLVGDKSPFLPHRS